ncbi:hypothetical protein DSO57_1036389 [Entomophthora muscae]|uniref:Uncharacterized protein n=1 Tax=Entomophthora muscae TaxID=34485 RepID=A0ACC2SZI1_9FUNG|nr:hypothetical protein DSO57_1036389 [Entomophthora muscae]
MNTYPFMSVPLPGLQERESLPSALLSTLPQGAQIVGLSVYKNRTYPLTVQNGMLLYPNISAGIQYTEQGKMSPRRGNVFYTSDLQAYTVNRKSGRVVKLSFESGSVNSESYRPTSGKVTDLYLDQEKQVYASSYRGSDSTAISTVWRFTEGQFTKLFTVPGIIDKFVLGKKKMLMFGVLLTYFEGQREKWLIRADVRQDGEPTAAKYKLIEEASSDETTALARDTDDNLYISWQNKQVMAYRSDLKPMYTATSSNDVRHLAVVEARLPTLYIGGYCKGSSMPCLDELNLDEESQPKQNTLYDVNFETQVSY